MATLEKIRNRAGLLVTVIGIALFAFIIGDFLKSGSIFLNQSKEKIAIVDGESISIRDYQEIVEETTNRYKSRNESGSFSEEQQNQIRQGVFDELVGSILLKQESEKVGFTVGKEELTDLIMGNNISPIIQQIPDFQNQQTGRFDKNQLLQFLQMIELEDVSSYSAEVQQQILSAKDWWLTVEKAIGEQKLASKFATLVTSALAVNSLDAKAAFEDNAVSVDFNYVSQAYSTIPDPDVEVTDAEIAKLYALRKNSYKQEGAKVIDYIAVNIIPSQEDHLEVARKLETLKEELISTSDVADIINEHSEIPYLDAYSSAASLDADLKNFIENASVGSVAGPITSGNIYNVYKLVDVSKGPDSIKVNHLALPAFDKEERLAVFADSLINVVKSGKTFAEMAQEATGGQGNGELGWQTEAALVRAVDAKFKNTLFDAKLNEVFVVKSGYGSHLVQIVEKTSPVTKYKVGIVRIEVTPSPETYNILYNKLNQYISRNNKLESFKTVAADSGYVCQTNIPVYENQPNIASIENSRQVIKWAYSNAKGKISDIFECQNYFIAAVVEGTLKQGVRPLQEVSELLKRELINEKKGEKIIASLKDKNLASLEDYAQALNATTQEVKFVTFSTPRITGIGVEPVVNARAIAAEQGKITGPFTGKNAVYVLSVTDKKTGEQTYDEASQKQQLEMQNRYSLMSAFQSNQLLKENAKIVDNRIRFY